MGVLVIVLLMISAVVLIISRRDRETFLITLLDLSLAEFWYIMLVYISKKGGLGSELETLLFGTRSIRLYLQYLIFTLGHLGYVMALGRFLFPLLLMWLALYYVQRIPPRTKRFLIPLAAVFPVFSLILYYPAVFEWAIGLADGAIIFLVQGSLVCIVLYLLLALFLLFMELHDTTMRFYRRRLAGRIAMIASLVLLYALYCPQDPAQVYLFYKNEYMGAQQGLWYLNPALNRGTYTLVFSLVIICSLFGVCGMLRYAWENILEGRQENAIRRKFNETRGGASVFVHSVKNQLLANRVLLKRMDLALKMEDPDPETLRDLHVQLSRNNSFMIERMEELYRTIRTNSIVLVEEEADEVIRLAIARFRQKYPDAPVECSPDGDITVLCDKNHLSEALYNLMINAWEAQCEAGQTGQPIRVVIQQERMWTLINVCDSGRGLSRDQKRHMFEPFWSSKNSNYNWGMGLYYVRQIVKSHFGVLRTESIPGQGTTVIIQLPRHRKSTEQ